MLNTNSSLSVEDAARQQQMRAGWDAYMGRFPQPLINRPRKGNDNVIVNRMRPVVDKSLAFLFGRDVIFQVESGADGQDYLDDLWKANRKMTLLQKLGLNGGVTGHAFIKIVPGIPYPRLVVIDPASVTVECAPDDVENITSYTIHYEASNDAGSMVEMRQFITRASSTAWLILDQQRANSKSQWQTTNTTTWPYSFAPLVECQNLPVPHSFWGLSDIGPDLRQINENLNFVYSNIQRIIKFHAHPKTYITGAETNKLKTTPDETIVLPEGATMGSLEMASDLSSSLNYAHDLETEIDVLSHVPSFSLGDMAKFPSGNVSGYAITLLFQPLEEKTEMKRLLYGDMLTELNRRLLAMAGYGPDVEVIVHWPEMTPIDPAAMANTAQIYLSLGISKDTVFSRLGFDYNEEQLKNALDAQNAAQPNPQTAVDPQITLTTAQSPADGNEENVTQTGNTASVMLGGITSPQQ